MCMSSDPYMAESPVPQDDVPFVLQPLLKRPPALIPSETIVAVNTVLLSAGEVPPGILRRFYERVLGLDHLASDEPDTLRFKHLRREVMLSRQTKRIGTLKLTLRHLEDVLPKLRVARIAYELLHTDDGLSTKALLREPAGNLVYLHESRRF